MPKYAEVGIYLGKPMENRLLRGALRWGALNAGVTFAIALLLPIPPIYDAKVIILLSPVLGFIVGVALQILNFLASEVVRFIEYQLTKVEGVTWSNHRAISRVRNMTACGLWGAGILLSIGILLAITKVNSNEFMILVPTISTVWGFALGVITYFVFWWVGPILGYLRPKGGYFRASISRGLRALMQLYQKLKHQDYRS